MRFSKLSRLCYTIALIAQIFNWKMGATPDWSDVFIPLGILVVYAWVYSE